MTRGSPLLKRTFRLFFQTVGAIGAFLAVALMLAVWRLSTGPVSLAFLTPNIEDALNGIHGGDFTIKLDDTILTWAGWERTLDIRVLNMRATTASGTEIAAVPEVSISLSGKALLEGVIAPRSIEFFGPSLLAQRDGDGRIRLGFEGGGGEVGADAESEAFVAGILGVLLETPDAEFAMTYLSRINVVAADLTYIDNTLGGVWRAPSTDIELTRSDSGIHTDISIALEAGGKDWVEEGVPEISILGDYDIERKRLELGASFDGLTPAVFSSLSEELDVLEFVNLPLSGTVTVSVTPRGQVEAFGFDIEGGAGHIALPVLVASRLGVLNWAQRAEIDRLSVSGRFDGERDWVEVSNLDIDFKDGESLYIPPPLDHELQVAALHGKGRFDGKKRRLVVDDLGLDLGTSKASLTAEVGGIPWRQEPGAETGGFTVDLTGYAENLPFDDADRLWPKTMAVDAREWVLANLSGGRVDHGTVNLALRPDGHGGTRLASLAGTMEGHGVRVDYLAPMPPALDATATATFNERRLDIEVISGHTESGLMATGGTISLIKLNTGDPAADITLDVQGPFAAGLALIDSEPLGFASILGIDPSQASGAGQARVALAFPFRHDLGFDDVTVSAVATLDNLGLGQILFNRDLAAGQMSLVADNEAMEIKGLARLGQVPIDLTWRHDFRDGAMARDRYDISGTIVDVLKLGDLGIDVPDVLGRYVQGGAGANVVYTVFGDDSRALSARIDMTDMQLAAPELGWAKDVGIPGMMALDLRMQGEQPVAIPSFEISAPDMNIRGSAEFRADGELDVVELARAQSGRTSFAGSIVPHDDGSWELSLLGESFDAELLWQDLLGTRDIAQGEDIPESDLVISVAADFRKLYLSGDRAIEDFIGTVYRSHGLWTKMDIQGRVGETEQVLVRLESSADGLRWLSIESDDAGQALRALDLYENMLDGTLDLKAAFTQPGNYAPLQGVLKVRDFAIVKAPRLTQLIGAMTLTGLLDALKGEGLNFDVLDVPFVLHKGVLKMTEARASGPTLGVTGTGLVDIVKQFIDIKGTVVPAYAINALLSDIPIIGDILGGPEKGSGIFAATYTMTGEGDQVEITINPLSALAPGSLRSIFSGSGKERDITAPKK